MDRVHLFQVVSVGGLLDKIFYCCFQAEEVYLQKSHNWCQMSSQCCECDERSSLVLIFSVPNVKRETLF